MDILSIRPKTSFGRLNIFFFQINFEYMLVFTSTGKIQNNESGKFLVEGHTHHKRNGISIRHQLKFYSLCRMYKFNKVKQCIW